MPLHEDVKQPTRAVRALYAARTDAGDDFGVGKHFAALAASGSTIPILTPSTIDLIPNNCLVRVRGMIQDMLNPEIFCNEFRGADGVWATARFQDDIDGGVPPNAEVKYGDRRPYVIIPVPAESPWVAEAHAAEAQASIKDLCSSDTAANAAMKRGREEEDVSVSLMVTDATGATTEAAAGDAVVDSAGSDRRRAAPAPGPAPAADGGDKPAAPKPAPPTFPAGACMVYLYSNSEETVKLNDIVEVVGIVSRTPELAAAHLAAAGADADGDAAMSLLDEEMLAAHPPTSQVPRIHAILLKKEDTSAKTAPALAPADFATARSRTLGFLSMVLGGDDLAAEYLLLQLVSSVHRRSKDGAVGVVPLNLTSCPAAEGTPGMSPLGEAVAAAVAALVPRAAALPLTLESLNGGAWVPRRGAEDVLMTSGALQLPAGTQIVADETVMCSGQLVETGLRNLGSLQAVMSRQTLPYDFQFFTMDQPTDAPVTVLSTARTMLKGAGEVVVPLRAAAAPAGGAAAVAAALAAGDATPARAYVAAARAAAAEFSIPEAVAGQLERDLAGAKQKDTTLGPESFHLWLNLARLLAVSHGEKELTAERWAQAMEMEGRRQARLTETPSA